MPPMEERLQAQLSALVGAAVDRVMQQAALPAEGLAAQLSAAQLEAAQLRQDLAEIQASAAASHCLPSNARLHPTR